MKRTGTKIKKCIALLTAMAVIVTSLPGVSTVTEAAKRPRLSKTSANIVVGNSFKVSVKNGIKRAKVSWKTTSKSIAKITSKNEQGNKAYAQVKGIKAGKVKIFAYYKLGKKTLKYTCTVRVSKAKDDAASETEEPKKTKKTTAPATEVPVIQPPATEVPATEVPVTEVPATEVPATEVPATEVPATEVPATASTTAAPFYTTAPMRVPFDQTYSAFYTSRGEELRKAAKISSEWDYSEFEGDTPFNAKTMTFVNTDYWKDVYSDNNSGSIGFMNAFVPGYLDNDESMSLKAFDRDMAQAYVIWDKEYAYVLVDVYDMDISPAAKELPYLTDSVEFCLDEDNTKGDSYACYEGITPTSEGYDKLEDAVRLRVCAINNAISSNESGTGKLEYVAHAVNHKMNLEGTPTGYQVEYIIKLQNAHKAGDVLGMDFLINDCYTELREGDQTEEGYHEPTAVARRVGVLTAYDQTNDLFRYPYAMGEVTLRGDDGTGWKEE